MSELAELGLEESRLTVMVLLLLQAFWWVGLQDD